MDRSKYFLRPLANGYPDIHLRIGASIIVGRNRSTKIKDLRLSRKHASLTARDKEGKVEYRQLGSNPSTCIRKLSGEVPKSLTAGQSIDLRSGDVIQLLSGKHKYQIISQNPSSGQFKMSEEKESSSGGWVGPNHWSQGLYASMKDPNMLLYEDDDICIIKDKYPKARHHYLVLPKEKFSDLSKMTAEHIPLIQSMVKRAEILTQEKKVKSYRMGFHCVPSMAQVHMHIISEDFDSPCLKNKKHWNSFTTAYFIHPDEVLEHLRKSGQIPFEAWKSQSKDLLNTNLKCHRCDNKLKNVPDLKNHLANHNNSE